MRFAVWKPALQIWRDHFWWGAGLAHFDYRFPQYRPVSVQRDPEYVHNDYLNTLADWGVAGAGLVASAWVLLFWGVGKTWRTVRGGRDDFSRKKSSKFALLVGASLGLMGILLHSLFDFNLHSPAIAILAVTLMALLSSQWRFETERFWFRAGTGLKCLGSVILAAGIGYLGFEGRHAAREIYWLRLADRVGQPPNHYSYAKIAALEHAAEVEPMNFANAHAIGECYRLKSFEGGDDHAALARKAMSWFKRGMNLNPYDGYNWVDYGRCLDWIAGEPGVAVAPTAGANSLTPTVSQRKVKSSISIASGQTVLLAGLISERQERGSSGLPILDQLPGILGSAFSERNNGLVRTELIIFIRPQIIRDNVDAHFVAEELRSKLRGTAGAEAPSGPLTTKPR